MRFAPPVLILSLVFAAGTAAAGGPPRGALPGAAPDLSAIPSLVSPEAHQQQVREQLRREGRFTAAGGADVTPPTLTSLAFTSSLNINVTQPPAFPKLRVGFSDDDSGISYVYAYYYFTGPEYTLNHAGYEYSETPTRNGTIVVAPQPFGLYDPAGAWVLTYVYLYDRAGNATYASGAALDAFLPLAQRTVTVTNPRAPDTARPTASAGAILTPTISLTPLGQNGQKLRLRLDVEDNISGVTYAYVCLRSPSHAQQICPSGNVTVPLTNGRMFLETYFYEGTDWETGNWTIYSINLRDVPGNYRFYDSGGQITSRFPNGYSISVTP